MPSPRTFCLRVLATSDVHMQLTSFDYFADTPAPGHGLQALAVTIKDLRAQHVSRSAEHQCLLVDNGDLLQGSVLGNELASAKDRSKTHPVADVMNRLGYTAFGLGNHDLDYGLTYLDWFAEGLDATILSSNVAFRPARGWLHRYVLHQAGEVCVGIISAMPPETLAACHALRGEDIQTEGMVTALKSAAEAARKNGADIILCLAHTGLFGDPEENALEEISKHVPIDALVGGHTHHLFPDAGLSHIPGADVSTGTLNGVPTVMPHSGATHVGCIDLVLEQKPTWAWSVTSSSAFVKSAAPASSDINRVCTPLAELHRTTRASLDTEVARIAAPLHSYFSRVMPTQKQAVIAAAQSTAIDAIRQGTEWADLPLLSAVSSPRAGGRGGPANYTDLPVGALKARQIAQLHVYSNLIWAVCVTGTELREWLDKSASAFMTVSTSSAKTGLVNDAVPSFDFDVIFGTSCEIDITQPARFDSQGHRVQDAGSRILNLSYQGSEISDDDRFLIAVNSFRASGGGKFPGFGPDRAVLSPDLAADDVVQQHLANGALASDGIPWRFSESCRGLRTWFDTGPGATRFLDDIAHLSPGTPVDTDTGFLRIPITL